MDRSDVITLVSETTIRDSYGIYQPVKTTRNVYAQVDSVTATEFFEGGRNGLNPEMRFTVFAADYNGEREVIWHWNSYAVYRTYLARGDNMELYCERKGGTNGEEDPAGTAGG